MTEGGGTAVGPSVLRARDLMQPEPLLVARGGRDGRLSYVNRALCDFFGRPADALVGQTLLDLTPEREGSQRRLRQVTEQAAHTVSELWMHDASERKRRLQWVTFPERSQDGRLVGFQVLGRDITALLEICDALLADERRRIDCDDMIFVADDSGRFRAYHARPELPLFSPPDVFLGATLEAALPPDLAARARVALGTALAIGLPQTFDYSVQQNGVQLGYRARILRIDPERALFICRDIDAARTDIEGADPTRGLLAAVPDLILRAAVASDGAVSIEPVNDNESTLSEFLQRARSVRGALDELVRRAVRSGEQQVLHEFQSSKRRDRATYEARVVRSGDQEAICFVRNIAERQQQIASMMEADRVRAISALVAGVGHQINNPLSYVMGNLDFLRAELDEMRDTLQDSIDAGAGDGHKSMGVAMAAKQALEAFDNVADALNDIDEGVNRISGIVHDLRVFNQDSHDLEPLDVCGVIDEALAIVDNEVRHRAQLARKYGGPTYVFGNRGRLQQLFLNVLLNAAHAIDEGAATSNDITVEVTRSDEDWVDIMISDSGHGMTPDVAEQVFDPFFTTKPVGEGSGLGLAVCREIARLHGGLLSIDSEQHIGTDVTVRLCAAAEPPDHDGPDGDARLERTADSVVRVLLVDDEPGVGRVVPRMLGDAARVTFCATARAALDEIEGGAEFDLVLCDVMMPEMTGMQFYQRLLERDDQLAERLVFVTGGAFTHAAQAFLDEVDAPVLYKPFDRAALHALLADHQRRS